MEKLSQLTISEIVARDYRSALVFRTFGIDFCCKGDQTIGEACLGKSINSRDLLEKLLEALTSPAEDSFDFKSWPLGLLTNYIETKHHALIQERVPMIRKFLKRVEKIHGAQDPRLKKVRRIFEKSSEDLQSHLEREELIIFPYIRKIAGAEDRKNLILSDSYERIREIITQLMTEHEQEGEYLEQIRILTNNYSPPEYASNTYKVALAMLEEFDMNMQKHMHLERNILFPGALELSQSNTDSKSSR